MIAPAAFRRWEPEIGPDQVLRGQGADPHLVRKRSPTLLALAARAAGEGRRLLDPETDWARVRIEAVGHRRIRLVGGAVLSGTLVRDHLGPAREVVALVLTIGRRLEARVAELLPSALPYALALEGFGTAAIEALAAIACREVANRAAVEGMRVSIPLSPGMTGWDVSTGQREIFALLGAEARTVRLTAAAVMLPRQSLSLVLGLGPEVTATGRPCDYCDLSASCRHRPEA